MSTSTNSSSSVGPTSSDNPPPVSSSDTTTDHHSSSTTISTSSESTQTTSFPSGPLTNTSVPISSFFTPSPSSSHATSSFALTTRVSYSNGRPYTTVIETVSAGANGISTAVRMTRGEKVGAVVGGVIGGLAFLVLASIGIFFFLRRRRKLERAKMFDGNFDPAYASSGPSGAASTIGFGTARSKRQSRSSTPRPMSQIVRNLSATSVTDPRLPTLPAVELDRDEFEGDDSLSALNGRHSRTASLNSSIPMSPVSSHSILAGPALFPSSMDAEQEGQAMRHSRKMSSPPPSSFSYGHTSGYQQPQAYYEHPGSTKSLSRSSSLHGNGSPPQDPFLTGAPPTPTSISMLPHGAQTPLVFDGGMRLDDSRRVSGRLSPPVRPRSTPLGDDLEQMGRTI